MREIKKIKRKLLKGKPEVVVRAHKKLVENVSAILVNPAKKDEFKLIDDYTDSILAKSSM